MLIDEIEKAEAGCSTFLAEQQAAAVTASPWWPRIRAALLAAREMEDRFDAHDLGGLDNACTKFREAMGE